MIKEDGFNVACRRFGMLGLALVPWALGIGAMAWLGVYAYQHTLRRELSQEERAAVYVGAKERPTAKIKILVEPSGCLVFDRVELDGAMLNGYFHATCAEHFIQLFHKLKSPDGTVISSGDDFVFAGSADTCLAAKEKAEFKVNVRTDDRAESIALRLDGTFCN